jgi:hypothetical protein
MENIKTNKELFDFKKELAQKLFDFFELKLIKNSEDIMGYSQAKRNFEDNVLDKKEFVSELRKNGDKKLADFIEEVFK